MKKTRSPFLNEPPQKLMRRFIYNYAATVSIGKCQASPSFNIDRALHFIRTNECFEFLTDKWYEQLDNGDLAGAYSVYDDDYYVTDLWNCFKQLSRKYLRNISTIPITDEQKPLTEILNSTQSVVDIGCGIGFTTSSLKQLFPLAKVYGTNLKDTKQWEWCRKMAKDYDWKLVTGVKEIEQKSGLVFASEYFEHILNPIEHVQEIVHEIEPKCFVIANAFNTRSIGHFTEYRHQGTTIPQDKISRQFNSSLSELGYVKLKTEFWNGRPNIWMEK